MGDACDDYDGDGWVDAADNCPYVSNPDQQNTDHSGGGDACDSDDDNDGKPDVSDNCPLVSNQDQADGDADGLGNACDLCPIVASSDNSDLDGDGLGDVCDPDDDGDGVLDASDSCPLKYNPEQLDMDHNGIGFACDDGEKDMRSAVFSMRFADGRLVVPLPDTCAKCGPGDNFFKFEQVFNIQTSLPVYAQVVSSDGLVSVHTPQKGGSLLNQTLNLHPAPYTVNRAAAVSALSVTSATAPAGPRNWLEIYAPPGTSPTQTFTMTLQLTERSGMELYLPLVIKN